MVDQWNVFEETLEKHSTWCKDVETFFKSQQHCATLQEKQDRITLLQDKRDEVVQYEREIDVFVDQGHALIRVSSVERLKPLITQLSNRYQSLHVLSKEAVTKWCGILADHKTYDAKFTDVSSWVESVDSTLKKLLKETNSDNRGELLYYLLSEKEQSSHKLGSITSLGERLFPDTATGGREKIRYDLRTMRETWEKIEAMIMEQQRKVEAQSMQSAAFQDSVNAAKTWLDNMEKIVAIDPSSLTTLPEMRSRLLKLKVIFVLFLCIF